MTDWQVGDLALCVKHGRWRKGHGRFTQSRGMNSGVIATVRRVAIYHGYGYPLATLWLEGWPGDGWGDGYAAHGFRKIRPHVPDAEDAETIRLLNGIKSPEPVS